MYTIVMRDDKSLRVTEKTTLYQREKLVDKMQFLIPLQYDKVDLSDFTVTLKYLDQGNVAHVEILSKPVNVAENTVEYNGYSRYILPIDTKLTQFSGDINIRITLSKVDLENKTQYVLHTGEATISILPLSDYYAFVTDESLEYIDQLIGNLDAKIEEINRISEIYDEQKADNIVRYDDGKVQLTSNGVPIGDSISLDGGINSELEVVEF